jgi:predicted secreted protein
MTCPLASEERNAEAPPRTGRGPAGAVTPASAPHGHLAARAGQPLSVELHANPAAGYAWRVDVEEARLELVEQRYRPAGPAPADAGVERFVFLPGAAGEWRIRFTYRRGGEAFPAEERIVLVQVR